MKNNPDKRLPDRVAIITGGARGIGKGIALRYALEGANIVIADLKEKEAAGTIKEIKKKGGKAIFIKTDITDNNSIENMVKGTLASFGKIDILVNNAGISLMRKITEASIEDWDKLNSVNLKPCVFYCLSLTRCFNRKKRLRAPSCSSLYESIGFGVIISMFPMKIFGV